MLRYSLFEILNNLVENKAWVVRDLQAKEESLVLDGYGVSQMAFGFTRLYYYVINTRRNTADKVTKLAR